MGEAVQRLDHRYHGSSALQENAVTEFGTGDACSRWPSREFGTGKCRKLHELERMADSTIHGQTFAYKTDYMYPTRLILDKTIRAVSMCVRISKSPQELIPWHNSFCESSYLNEQTAGQLKLTLLCQSA